MTCLNVMRTAAAQLKHRTFTPMLHLSSASCDTWAQERLHGDPYLFSQNVLVRESHFLQSLSTPGDTFETFVGTKLKQFIADGVL